MASATKSVARRIRSKARPPRVPHLAFNQDDELAAASIRKLAALEPRVAWGGHAEPVRGDVAAQLGEAAATIAG